MLKVFSNQYNKLNTSNNVILWQNFHGYFADIINETIVYAYI